MHAGSSGMAGRTVEHEDKVTTTWMHDEYYSVRCPADSPEGKVAPDEIKTAMAANGLAFYIHRTVEIKNYDPLEYHLRQEEIKVRIAALFEEQGTSE